MINALRSGGPSTGTPRHANEVTMPSSTFLELARAGAYEQFEATCLEALEAGRLDLAALVSPFEQFEQAGQAERLVTLTQMIFENVAPESAPNAALRLVRVALNAAPQNDFLRQVAVRLYRQLYADRPGVEALLEASGLSGARPVRTALNILDLCLTLQPGDALLNRLDGRVVEVAEVELGKALFTLREAGRIRSLPAADVAREYERLDPDDFRVLRNLRPERLNALLHEDPVTVVLGLIRAHGGQLDLDELKQELVPRFLEPEAWSGWWTQARTRLKRCPNIVLEGRAPVILRHVVEARTLEDQTWETLSAQRDPLEWHATIAAYLREKAGRKESPDPGLLQRCHDFLLEKARTARARRPPEAFATALVIASLASKGLPTTEESRTLAQTMLRDAPAPDALLSNIADEDLCIFAWDLLRAARPDDWPRWAGAALPNLSANVLDRVAAALVEAGHGNVVQTFIDAGLADLAHHPELAYWLWKGPTCAAALRLPPEADLLRTLLDVLSALGRTVTAEAKIVKQFRARVRTALALKDFERVRRCLAQCSEAAAITLRHQLRRLEGVGTNTRTRLLELLREAHPQLWVVKPQKVTPWTDTETIWATREGLRRRTAERDEILNVKLRENAKRIGEAASHGDLSENSEYKFALEERDLLRARVARLNDELSRARVLTSRDVPDDHVGIGSRVTVRRLDTGQELTMTFLGPFEADSEQGIYSYLAPLAQKLMGARVGDRVTVNLDGREVQLEVLTLASALLPEND
jgi:transcription elongation GreA/GreB family factor